MDIHEYLQNLLKTQLAGTRTGAGRVRRIFLSSLVGNGRLLPISAHPVDTPNLNPTPLIPRQEW